MGEMDGENFLIKDQKLDEEERIYWSDWRETLNVEKDEGFVVKIYDGKCENLQLIDENWKL